MSLHIYFHDEFDPAKHPRGADPENAGRFSRGGNTGGRKAKGEAEGFVSPNEGNLDFPTALKELRGKREALFRKLSPEIDHLAGIDEVEVEPVLGAWKTGAEHSTMVRMHNTTPERAELALALKGLLTNQLQVLRFVPGRGGEYLASFKASGTPEEIHQSLLDHNVAFHTMQIQEDGATVHVYGSDQETMNAVSEAARQYGSKVQVLGGKGKFIGTEMEDGTDETQRADARRIYQDIIDRAVTAGQLRRDYRSKWDDIRDRWRREATEDKRYFRGRPIRIGDRLYLHMRGPRT